MNLGSYALKYFDLSSNFTPAIFCKDTPTPQKNKDVQFGIREFVLILRLGWASGGGV